MGAGQPGRAGADDGDFFLAALRDLRRLKWSVMGHFPVEGETLQMLDRHRLIHVTAVAFGLAGVVAHPPADHRKGVALMDQLGGFVEAALADQRHVTRRFLTDRAGFDTGGTLLAVDHVSVRHRLGERLVDGGTFLRELVEPVGHPHRAHFHAGAAGGALIADIAGFLAHLHLKIAHIAADVFHFRHAHQLDVGLMAGADHFGSQDTGGAVQGGKGLVELGHLSPDGRFLFDQVDRVTGFTDLQRGLNAGDAASHDQGAGMDLCPARAERYLVINPADSGIDQRGGFAGGLVNIIVHPGAVLADIGHLEEIAVQAGPFTGIAEGQLVHVRRAGRHHHPGQAFGLNVFFDHLLPGIGAHKFIGRSNGDIGLIFQRSGDIFHPYVLGNIDAAMADIDPDFLLLTHWVTPAIVKFAESGRQLSLEKHAAHPCYRPPSTISD